MLYKSIVASAALPVLAGTRPTTGRASVSTRSVLRRASRESCLGYTDPRLEVEVFGLKFRNPLGLAAGFDKTATLVPAWPVLGFGFAELGTITAQGQPGNPRPRLFRIPADKAIVNRMGFNNDGAEAVAKRLRRYRRDRAAPDPGGSEHWQE